MKQWFVYSVFVIGAIVGLYLYEQLHTYPTTLSQEDLAAKTAENSGKELPPNKFTQDGCTLFPNRLPWHDFRSACLQHDIVYWAGGTKEERKAADVALRETISHTGPIGPVIAYIIYPAVRLFGDTSVTKQFNSNWGYGWNEQI